MEGDLYRNTGTHQYLRVAGVYYKWTMGKGWAQITPQQAEGEVDTWFPLAPAQYEVYRDVLPGYEGS